MSLRVFLCHASEDKPEVKKLYTKLKERGYRPWLDSEDLIGGQEWDAEITKAVRDSHVVAVCLSHHSITKQGYVQKEVRVALDAADYHPDGQIFIVPVRFEDCALPERLQKWHAIDLFRDDGFERLERSLLMRGLAGAFIRQPDLDYSSPVTDGACLDEVRSILASVLPPTQREVMEELKHAAERLRHKADYRSAEHVCVASRTALFHLQELAWVADPKVARIATEVDDLLQDCVQVLERISDKRAEQYARSVKNRARIVRDLRKTIPRSRTPTTSRTRRRS